MNIVVHNQRDMPVWVLRTEGADLAMAMSGALPKLLMQ